MRVEINQYIIADNKICHGQPTFKGTRIMVSIILEMLQDNAKIEEIIQAYPSLTKDHIKASLQFAAKLAGKRFKLTPA